MLAVVPLLFCVSLFFRKRILRTSRIVRKTNSRITATYNEGIVGVRTSKVFVREEENLRDFDRLTDEMYGHSVRNAVLSAVYLPIILTLGSVAIAMALAMGGHQVIVGALTVGEIVMFIYYAQLFFAPVQDMSAWFAEMQMAQASAERVLEPRGSGARGPRHRTSGGSDSRHAATTGTRIGSAGLSSRTSAFAIAMGRKSSKDSISSWSRAKRSRWSERPVAASRRS